MLNYAGISLGMKKMTDTRPLVVVVDDDISTREGLAALLETTGCLVRCFESATSFLAWDAPAVPSCLLLDVSLPDLDGLELQARIGDDRPEMPIIFITGHGDIPMTVRAMRAGAVEFLTKPLGEDALLNAVDRAIEQSRTALEEKTDVDGLRLCHAALSPREKQVMALVVTGLLNKQVGWELGISEITVKAHRGRVMEKMKARSFADLVKMSARLELDPIVLRDPH